MTALRHVEVDHHPIEEPGYADDCRRRLDRDGALVLSGFLTPAAVERVRNEHRGREADAYFTTDTHNVTLTPVDPAQPATSILERQIVSTKGCLADDQIAGDSLLRDLYESPVLRRFLSRVVGVETLHPYADELSSINVHFHRHGEELGWHFDNSSFAVTMLIQAPRAGGHFEYVPDLRDAAGGDLDLAGVERAIDDGVGVHRLEFGPGDLVVFRGRNALHRVTPTTGSRTRILVVFAFNAEPGIGLSDQAKETFYGRVG